MGLVKNGFVDLGNGFYINENQVIDHDDKYIYCKHGEKYQYNELPKEVKYMEDLYGGRGK